MPFANIGYFFIWKIPASPIGLQTNAEKDFLQSFLFTHAACMGNWSAFGFKRR
jgi:hypothetical protein